MLSSSSSVADTISSMIIIDYDEDSLTVIGLPEEDLFREFPDLDFTVDINIEGETTVEDESSTEFDTTSLWSSADSDLTRTAEIRPQTRGELNLDSDNDWHFGTIPSYSLPSPNILSSNEIFRTTRGILPNQIHQSYEQLSPLAVGTSLTISTSLNELGNHLLLHLLENKENTDNTHA